jgi:nitroimidazol reductase NimA-like FMN-containing flavoprotein (pyridoxamine 5'-phosphate oxidase superfamily)
MSFPSPTVAPSARTKVRRAPARARYERDAIEAILDEALVSHLGFVHDGQPYVIPTLHARVGATLYVHGSAASRAIRTLAAGAPACLTATVLDGLVLARSAFHHSVNYRSVVVLGTARPVGGAVERREALRAFTERLVPGRWDEVRAPSEKELRGTQVLAMDLAEVSAKVRSGPPIEEPEDLSRATWSGVIPLRLAAAAPQPAPELTSGLEPSAVVAGWVARRS